MSSKTLVFTIGRFQPPHKGHEVLFNSLHNETKKIKRTNKKHTVDEYIFVSASCNDKNNPLTADERIHYLNIMFPDMKFIKITRNTNIFYFIYTFANTNKYTKMVGVFGPDRADNFQTSFNSSKTQLSPIPVPITILEVADRIETGTHLRKLACSNTQSANEKFIEQTKIGLMQRSDCEELLQKIKSKCTPLPISVTNTQSQKISSHQSRSRTNNRPPPPPPTPPTRVSRRLQKLSPEKI
jgi:nicotinic acid mononucleotide adenylyltransferase